MVGLNSKAQNSKISRKVDGRAAWAAYIQRSSMEQSRVTRSKRGGDLIPALISREGHVTDQLIRILSA